MLPDGSLLAADDAGNIIWRVSYTGGAISARPASSTRSEREGRTVEPPAVRGICIFHQTFFVAFKRIASGG